MIFVIDGQEIDLGNEISAITKQAFNIDDISQRLIGRTNGFEIPLSNQLLKKLKHPSYINSSSRSFEVFYNCKLKDNNNIIFKGIGILLEFGKSAKLQLTDKSKMFFDSLNEHIRELDFESDDFLFNTAAYNTLKTPSSSVWLWSGASMHENKVATNTFLTDLKYSRPFLNVRKIFDKIFSQHGWSYNAIDHEVSFIDTINTLILSTNHAEFNVTDYQKTIDDTIILSGSPVLLTDFTVNDFQHASISSTSNTIDIKTHNCKFRLRGNITVNGSDIKITFKGTSSPLGTNVQYQEFYLSENETYIDITTNVFKTDEATNNIQIEMSGNGSIIFEDTLLYTVIEEQTLGDLSTNPLAGFMVKYHENAPDFTQLELMRNLWTIIGMIWNDDSFTKAIDIFTFQQYNKLNSLDWSNKFNRDIGTWTLTNKIGSLGKYSYLKYDNDEQTPDKTGESYIFVDDDTIQNEVDLITLGFSASPEVQISSINMADIPAYEETKRKNTLNPRICTYYTNGAYTVAEFKETLSWEILKEGNNKKLFDSLQRPRYLEGQFDLNRYDVTSWDHTKVVYIDYFQSYFIVPQIADFVPGFLTDCKLLKLN